MFLFKGWGCPQVTHSPKHRSRYVPQASETGEEVRDGTILFQQRLLQRWLLLLTCASLCHSLPGTESSSDGGDHKLVQGSRSQSLKVDGVGVHWYTLILDNAAVMDQQDLVGVKISRNRFPLHL